MKILIMEDDRILADAMREFLQGKGFKVEVVYDGESGYDYAILGIYDLLIMDVLMPGLNGLTVARRVREHRVTTPILMLSDRADVQDRIDGLNAGADYYLGKPFDNRELMACINALLRRQGSQMDNLVFGNTELELSTALLRCGDKSVRLTAKEFDVLRQLLCSGDRLVSKETLLARVWGFDTNAVENHVEVYMAFLRKKLRSIGSNVQIVAVRRMGYHLELNSHD
jgi:DNA-binding response OmpR family regulator